MIVPNASIGADTRSNDQNQGLAMLINILINEIKVSAEYEKSLVPVFLRV